MAPRLPSSQNRAGRPDDSWQDSLTAGLKKPVRAAQRALKHVAQWLYRRAGLVFLDKAQTEAYLRPHQLAAHPQNALSLPEVPNHGAARPIFPATQAVTAPVFVWRYAPGRARARLLPYGGIVADGRVLCTDDNTADFHRNTLALHKRATVHAKTLLAPWSHYLDGFMWGGYYDFVFIVAAKLCRMKAALPAPAFHEALVAYPLFGTAYEREYLALLGIGPEQVFDSRQTNVRFDACVLGNAGHWFYPNAADVAALRDHVLAQMPPAPAARKRIYVSRAGRRRVRNETELIGLLKTYGFEVIADTPRTVAEQVALYRGASFIIGPHGASFTNILWCRPGTHLFELFSATYTPGFFHYLAKLLGLCYSAFPFGTATSNDWAAGLNDDMVVSIPELAACLSQLLQNVAS